MNVLVLDLEMAQPSRNIIQIGAVVGNLKDGSILESYSQIVNPQESLSDFIINLTGITQEQVDKGSTLLEAYKGLATMAKKHKCHKQIVVWGDGDVRVLKEQVRQRQALPEKEWWKFGFRHFDTKTLFQSLMMAKSQTMKAGLKTACDRLGIEFDGKEHDALADAKNTWTVFYAIQVMLKTLPYPTIPYLSSTSITYSSDTVKRL